MCYTKKESDTQINIYGLEPKTQWTNYNINKFNTKQPFLLPK